MAINSFHLSLAVKSLEDEVNFFLNVLECSILHRDPSGYVNIDFFGSEVTLKQNASANPDIPDFHFGMNFDLMTFESLATKVLSSHQSTVVMQPKVLDAGTPLERKKMYLKSPTGYLIELKGYRGSTLPRT